MPRSPSIPAATSRRRSFPLPVRFKAPTRFRAPTRFKAIAGLAALSLIASACGLVPGDITTAEEATGVEVDDATPPFDPFDTTDPFDLDGGVESGNLGVEILSNDRGPSALQSSVQGAVGLWSTDWSKTTVDLTELAAGLGGSDTRDGIPPIDDPKFETPAQASRWLGLNEPGALVQVDGEARFYPLSILTRHEIVNDRFGDVPVAVTYCPLCNTALAFDRRVDGQVLRFGVSGLLRQSDLVMWDATTNSLWQQITGEAIVGEFAGTQLGFLSTAIVSFDQFQTDFPDGRSLSRDTGFRISYGANPYSNYSSSGGPIGNFFQGETDPRLDALERVVGVSIGEPGNQTDAAYPFGRLQIERVVNDEVGGEPVALLWAGNTNDALDNGTIANSRAIGTAIALDPVVDGERLTFTATDATADRDATFTDDQTGSTWTVLGRAIDGELAGTQLGTVPHRNEFWFAWASFFPEGELRP